MMMMHIQSGCMQEIQKTGGTNTLPLRTQETWPSLTCLTVLNLVILSQTIWVQVGSLKNGSAGAAAH